MNFIDFIIGLTLMNAMPHFVLGVWNQRMLALFGYSRWSNIAYGILNGLISMGLFIHTYGLEGLWKNGIYTGALAVLVVYYFTSHVWKKLFSSSS